MKHTGDSWANILNIGTVFAYPVRLTRHLHTRRGLMCVNIFEFRVFDLVEMFALRIVNKNRRLANELKSSFFSILKLSNLCRNSFL
jgi:hypothetical protein